MLVLLLSLFTAAHAAPGIVPIQGVLTDSVGAAVDGDIRVTFRMVTDDTGSIEVWADTLTVAARNGRFAVDLGSNAPLDLDLFAAHPRLYLGVTVDSDSEMPLVPLSHVPYAAWAENSARLGGQTAAELEAAILTVTDTQYLSSGYVPQWSNITGVPPELLDGDADTTYSGSDFVISNQACGAGSAIVALSANGGIVCESVSSGGFTTEAELTALLDDNYLGASYVPTWASLPDVPAGFADGVDNDTIYTDGDAVAAMGALGDGNPLHHARYGDAAAVSAVETADLYVRNTGDTISGDLVVSGSISVGGALTATLPCPSGFTSVSGGRLCVETALNPPLFMYEALEDCRNKQAHVCTHGDLQQACSVFNAYEGSANGWYGDHALAAGGNTDDEYLTWNRDFCDRNNDGPAQSQDAVQLPYRCCQ